MAPEELVALEASEELRFGDALHCSSSHFSILLVNFSGNQVPP
jgi:hypothetical protein